MKKNIFILSTIFLLFVFSNLLISEEYEDVFVDDEGQVYIIDGLITVTYATFEVYVKDPYGNPVSGVNLRCQFHYKAQYYEGAPWVEEDDYVTGPTNNDGYALFKLLKEIPPEPHDPDPNQMPLYPENLAQNGIYISIIYLPEEHWQTTYPRYDFEWMEVTIIDPEITILSSINTHSVLNTNVAQFNVVEDADGNGIYDAYELPLAKKFAPIYKFHQNNPLFPMPVEAVYGMNNATIVNNSSDYLPLPIANHNDVGWNNFFTTILEPQFNNGTFSPTVYCHTFKTSFEEYGGSMTDYYVIQYWTYYPYDDAANVHEGDWEHIDVIVDDWDPNFAQGVGAVYYHHRTSTGYSWSSIEKSGTHPYVYVGGKQILRLVGKPSKARPGNSHEITGASFASAGAHYSIDYPTSLKEGLLGNQTIGYIKTWVADEEIIEDTNPSRILYTNEYSLFNMNLSNKLWWMDYSGHWGVHEDVVKSQYSNYETISYNLPILLPEIGSFSLVGDFDFPQFTEPPKCPPYHDKWEKLDRLPTDLSFQIEGPYEVNGERLDFAIKYTLLARTRIRFRFFTVTGSLIKSFDWATKERGTYTLFWDWKNNAGTPQAHSVYILRINTDPNNILSYFFYLNH